VPAPRPPAGGSHAPGSQWAAGNVASKLRWAELDSRNERLATAADSVPANLTDSDRKLKAS
jgi:hypothetical protein